MKTTRQFLLEASIASSKDNYVSMILPSPQNMLLDFKGSKMELRYLNFFYDQTAPVLAGYLDLGFWNRLVPQIGQSEPTIQHAMIAVASVHELVESQGSSLMQSYQRDYTTGKDTRFALQQYNKAIYNLKLKLGKASHSEDITLLCCILFTCLEFLRGEILTAIAHIQSGIQIWESLRIKAGQSSLNPVFSKHPVPDSIHDNVAQIFSRLSVQSLLCGRPTPYHLSDISVEVFTDIIPPTFSTLWEADAVMNHLMKVSLQFMKIATRYMHGPPCDTKDRLKVTQRSLRCQLERWSDAFMSLIAVTPFTRSYDRRASLMLQIHNHVSKIWLVNFLEAEETSYDSHVDEFRSIIGLVSLLNNDSSFQSYSDVPLSRISSSKKRPRGFTFEMGVIPVLYFTATKCRNPTVRRAAVSLLTTTMPRREGLWDANLSIAIVERIIEIEESGLDVGNAMPPSRQRIYDAIFYPYKDSQNSQHVTFLSKPDGPAGGWVLKEEMVTW